MHLKQRMFEAQAVSEMLGGIVLALSPVYLATMGVQLLPGHPVNDLAWPALALYFAACPLVWVLLSAYLTSLIRVVVTYEMHGRRWKEPVSDAVGNVVAIGLLSAFQLLYFSHYRDALASAVATGLIYGVASLVEKAFFPEKIARETERKDK